MNQISYFLDLHPQKDRFNSSPPAQPIACVQMSLFEPTIHTDGEFQAKCV